MALVGQFVYPSQQYPSLDGNLLGNNKIATKIGVQAPVGTSLMFSQKFLDGTVVQVPISIGYSGMYELDFDGIEVSSIQWVQVQGQSAPEFLIIDYLYYIPGNAG